MIRILTMPIFRSSDAMVANVILFKLKKAVNYNDYSTIGELKKGKRYLDQVGVQNVVVMFRSFAGLTTDNGPPTLTNASPMQIVPSSYHVVSFVSTTFLFFFCSLELHNI